MFQGPVSIWDKTSHCKICKLSQSLEAARFVFRIVRSLWNLQAPRQQCCRCACYIPSDATIKLPISRLRDFTRSPDKTSYRILKRGPGRKVVRGIWTNPIQKHATKTWMSPQLNLKYLVQSASRKTWAYPKHSSHKSDFVLINMIWVQCKIPQMAVLFM